MTQGTLTDKVVWVTGAGRGIGKEIALLFGSEGAVVVLSSRTFKEIDTVAQTIIDNGGRALSIQCDVSMESKVKSSIEKIESELGKVDIMINNAGVGKFMSIIETTSKDLDNMFNINLKGTFLCTQAVLPSMISRKQGHIVNNISVAGIKPFKFSGAYCASKYGVMGLTAVTREEAREHNVKVTAIIPGATDTSIWDSVDGDFNRSKMMAPKDIATAVVDACKCSNNTLVEDVILRPIGGDF